MSILCNNLIGFLSNMLIEAIAKHNRDGSVSFLTYYAHSAVAARTGSRHEHIV